MFREIWFLHPLPHSQSASPLNLHPTYLPQIPSPRSQPRGPRLTHCPRPPGQGCLAEGLLPPIEQGWGTEHKPRSSVSVGDQGHLHITLGPPTSAQGHLHITLGPLHLCPGSPAYHSLGSPPHTHLCGSHYLDPHCTSSCTVWTLALVLVPIHREVEAVAPSYIASRWHR